MKSMVKEDSKNKRPYPIPADKMRLILSAAKEWWLWIVSWVFEPRLNGRLIVNGKYLFGETATYRAGNKIICIQTVPKHDQYSLFVDRFPMAKFQLGITHEHYNYPSPSEGDFDLVYLNASVNDVREFIFEHKYMRVWTLNNPYA
jgi:hypothetical protein